MSTSTKKTNNAFPILKKELRKIDLPIDARLLDCYAGNHQMWDGVKLATYYPIDVESYEKISVKSDNLKIMKSLDLSLFNVIDVDAYGVPAKQLEIIFNSRFEGTVYFTFIQTMFGRIPNIVLYENSITPAMLSKTSTLFMRNGFEKFKNYPAKRGVKKVKYYNPAGTNKYYGLFVISH